MARASYHVKTRIAGFLVIADDDGAVSVTNDAEAVVKELEDILAGRRLLYYDTEGCLDELKIDIHGEFAGFGPAPKGWSFIEV